MCTFSNRTYHNTHPMQYPLFYTLVSLLQSQRSQAPQWSRPASDTPQMALQHFPSFGKCPPKNNWSTRARYVGQNEEVTPPPHPNDACQVGEDPTFSVPALSACEGLWCHTTTTIHDTWLMSTLPPTRVRLLGSLARPPPQPDCTPFARSLRPLFHTRTGFSEPTSLRNEGPGSQRSGQQ